MRLGNPARVIILAITTAVMLVGLTIAPGITPPAQAGDFTLATAPGAIAWSPDGQYAYFSPATQNYGYGYIKRLDLSSGTVTDILTMSDPGGCHAHASALAITPDGTTLLAGGYSCVFTIPLSNPSSYTSTYTGFDWATRVVAGSNSGYAVGSRNGLVYKIAKASGTWGPSWTYLAQNTSNVSRWLSLSSDESTLYVGMENGNARVITTSTGAESSVTGSGPSNAVAVAPDGSYLLTVDGQRTLRKTMLTGSDAGTVTTRSYADEWGMQKMVIDPTGTYAYVGSVFSRSLVKISTADLAVVDRLNFRTAYPSLSADTPSDLAASPSALRAQAANEVLVSSSALSRIIQLPSVAYAPTSLTVTPADDSATINFTPANSAMSDVTNYEYRLDGTGTWTALSPADATSPVTVPGLTNGTPVGIELRAVNAQGSGAASSSVTVTPQSTPRVPLSVAIAAGNGQVSISFSAPASDGGFPVTNYEVSTDGGTSWQAQSPAVTSGPITVGGLSNGVQYMVSLRAVNALGSGTASSPAGVTPNPPSAGSGTVVRIPDPTPSATPTPSPSSTTAPPAQVSVPEPVAVGEGLVVIDGRATRVAVTASAGGRWQVQGEGFSLEFLPKAPTGDLEGSFTARAGTTVLVRGDGFAAGTLIATYLPGALADSLGQSRIQDDGTFEVEALLPASLKQGTYVFQVNGLGTATSVRSVNLGMQLLPATTAVAKASALRIRFAPGSAVITDASSRELRTFLRKLTPRTASAVIVPTTGAGASRQDNLLARQRATQIRSALKARGFDKPIRVASVVRKTSSTQSATGATLWLRPS